MRCSLLALLVFTGCQPTSPGELTLNLRERANDPDAFTDALAEVELVVAVLGGNDGEGGRCIVNQRCADFYEVLETGEVPLDIDDLQAALKSEAAPLFDFAASDATTLTVVGRSRAQGCFCSEREDADETFCGAADQVCGVADLADATADGRLQVNLTEAPCPERSQKLCPP